MASVSNSPPAPAHSFQEETATTRLSPLTAPTDISALSAIAIDFNTGEVLYEKDADTLRAPASMTKVMTAFLIFEALEKGTITLDTELTITRAQNRISNDDDYPAMVYLPVGDVVDVDTMLKLILLPSASASCIAMAEAIDGSESAFVEHMNETARELGIDAQYFNSHGAQVNYISARGQAMLIREFIQRYPQVLEYTSLASVRYNGKTYKNTNPLLKNSYYEGADGFKTGTTREAGYCLASTVEQEGERVISVIMRAMDVAHRTSDSTDILDYSFAVLAQS